jgi:hypothetical protein
VRINIKDRISTYRVWYRVRDNVGYRVRDQVMALIRSRVSDGVENRVRDRVKIGALSNLESPQRIPMSVMISALKSIGESSWAD